MKNETRADKKFHRVLREYYRNELRSSSGEPIKNRERAIAIAFSEARKIDPRYHITKHANGTKIKIDNTLQLVFEDAWQHYWQYIKSISDKTQHKTFEQWLRTTNEGLKYNKRMAQLIRNENIIAEPQMNERGTKISNNDEHRGGKIRGHLHRNGGVRATIVDTNKPVELERDELVITKGVARSEDDVVCIGKPEGVASRLNEKYGGDKISNKNATCHLKTEIMERGGKMADNVLFCKTEIDYTEKNKSKEAEIFFVEKHIHTDYGSQFRFGFLLNEKPNEWKMTGKFIDVFAENEFIKIDYKKNTLTINFSINKNHGKDYNSSFEKQNSDKIYLIIIYLNEKYNTTNLKFEKISKMENGTKIKSFLGIDEQSKIKRQIEREQQLKNNEMEHGKKIETNDVILKINEPREFAIVSFLTQKSFCELKLFKYDDICIYSGPPESMEELSKFMDAFNIHYTEFDNHFEFDDWMKKQLPSRIKNKFN